MEYHSTVILLGNGYDVAYGYDTRYRDFYEDDLFKNLCKVTDKTNNKLAQFIQKANEEKGKDNWSDLEEELYNYSRYLTETSKNSDPPNIKLDNKDVRNLNRVPKLLKSAENFYKDFQELQDCLGQFIVKKTDKSQSHNNVEQDRQLKFLTSDWLNEDESTLVVSFNYTNLLQGRNSKANVLYVHGTIHELQPVTLGSTELEPSGGYHSHNIVLGIDEAMQVETAHSFLYKSYNEPTNIHHLASVLKNAKRYIIFGCSIGETDRWYFENIFNREQSDKTFEIYHYKTSEQLNMNSRIKDISKVTIADFKERNNVLYLDSSNIEKALEKRRDYYKKFPFNP